MFGSHVVIVGIPLLINFVAKQARITTQVHVFLSSFLIYNQGVTYFKLAARHLLASEEERLKFMLHIILSDINTGKSEYNYDMSLVLLDLEPLSVRREKLCLTFAKKTVKSRHCDMFQKKSYLYDTRQATHAYNEHYSNTQRCYKSPLNYLTRMLNEQVSK